MRHAVAQLMRTPCVVEHRVPGAPDEYGDPVLDTTASTERCLLAQQSRNETGPTPVDVARFDVFFPHDVRLAATDRVVVAGVPYEVVGPPWAVADPVTGRPAYVIATLERRQ